MVHLQLIQVVPVGKELGHGIEIMMDNDTTLRGSEGSKPSLVSAESDASPIRRGGWLIGTERMSWGEGARGRLVDITEATLSPVEGDQHLE